MTKLTEDNAEPVQPAGQQEKLQLVRDKLASFRSATNALEQALESKPSDARLLTSLGYNYINVQEYDQAAAAFQEALSSDPSLYRAGVGLGECYKQLGDAAKAAEVFEGLFRAGDRSLPVLGNLSELPKSLVEVDLLSVLDKMDSAPVTDKDAFRSSLAFCKAAALDKGERYAEAWAQLVAANDLKQKLLERDHPEQSDWSTGAQTPGGGREAPLTGRPFEEGVPLSLFIFGPSRSGKTMMEALVANTLPSVKRGFENVIITDIREALKTAGLFDGGGLDTMALDLRTMFRNVYLEELAQRTSDTIFTNTAPGLITDALAIAELVPNARLIFVKRDIDDTAIRIYMKDYEKGRHAYAYSVHEIYAHIRWYYYAIDRLAELLPEVSRTVTYEQMIEFPESAIDVAAELCGVPVQTGEVPRTIGDRGCAEPYRDYLKAAITGGQ